MIINDEEKEKGEVNESFEDSRINNQDLQDNENPRKQSQSGFIRSKL